MFGSIKWQPKWYYLFSILVLLHLLTLPIILFGEAPGGGARYAKATVVILIFYGISRYGYKVAKQMTGAAAQPIADNEERLRAILDGAADAIITIGEDGIVQSFNPAAERIFGYPANEIVGHNVNTIVPSPHREHHDQYIRRFLRNGEVRLVGTGREAEGIRKDGTVFPIELSISAAWLENRYLFTGIIRDISERRLAEQREAELGRILEHSSNEVYIFDASTLRFLQVNHGARSNLGYTLEEMREMTPLDLKPQFDKTEFERLLEPLWIGEQKTQTLETIHIRKDQTSYPVEVHLQMSSFRGVSVFVANVLDITKRQEAERALKTSEERFELAVAGSSDGIWDWNLVSNEVFYSPRFEELLDLQTGDLNQDFEAWKSRIHPDDLAAALAAVDSHLIHRTPYDVEYRILTRVHEYRWFRARGQAIWNEDGTPTRMAGSITDITKQRLDQDALAKANLQKQAVLDAASEVSIIATDPEGIITLFNRGAEKLLGYAAVEMIGTQTPVLIHLRSEIEQRAAELLHELGREVTPFEVFIAIPQLYGYEEREWTYVRKDGSHRTVHLAVTCVRDKYGSVTGYLGVATDITDRKEAERELQRLAIVAAKTDNAVVITDAWGNIEWVNEAFTRLTDYSLEEVVGKKPGSVLQGPETDAETVASMGSAIREGRSFEGEVYNYAKDGRGYWLALSITPIRDDNDKILGYIAIEMEISDRKQAEAELQQAKEAAEAANLAKSQFLANMSHEIRTPMNGILGMTELALDTDLTTEQRDCLETVQGSANSLLAVINDVLDFSKIEAGQLSIEQINFQPREVLAATMRAFEVRSQQKGLQLTWSVADNVPQQVTGDPHRLRQILVNLVGNSIKFTDAGCVDVQVSVWNRTITSICLHFQVNDTGIGIPEEKKSDIFDPFSQADTSTTRNFGGTGLGLSISAKLIDLMKGRIWLESQVGRGSTFHFTAEFAHTARGLERPNVDGVGRAEHHAPSHSQPLNILLVEDNHVNQKVAFKFLRKHNHSVRVANNGEEAVSAAAEEQFDIIFMDVQMPIMDGLTATAAIRELDNQRGQHTPIVALTAHTMAGDRERMLEAGMDAYLSKPVRHQDLLATIDQVVFALPESSGKCQEAASGSAVFDSAAAMELAGDDLALLKELVGYVLSDCPALMEQLRHALDGDDTKMIARSAHGLKGTFGQVAGIEARATAATLETLAREEHREQLEPQYEALEQSIERLYTALNAWLAEA